MLSMKAVDLIEKRYLDTGEIDNAEIMGLIRTIRVKNQQLSGAVKTIENLNEHKVSIFRDGDGKIIATERTVNISDSKTFDKFTKILTGVLMIISLTELITLIKVFL